MLPLPRSTSIPPGKAERAAVGCGAARLELAPRGEDERAGELGNERSEPLTWSGVFILRKEMTGVSDLKHGQGKERRAGEEGRT